MLSSHHDLPLSLSRATCFCYYYRLRYFEFLIDFSFFVESVVPDDERSDYSNPVLDYSYHILDSLPFYLVKCLFAIITVI